MDISQCLGDYLREQRLEKGLSLKDVSLQTKIAETYLLALEQGAYDRLPAETYLKGFLASYADVLALPDGEILRMYQAECPEPVKPLLEFPAALPASRSLNSSLVKKLTCVILLLLVLAVFSAWRMVSDGGLDRVVVELATEPVSEEYVKPPNPLPLAESTVQPVPKNIKVSALGVVGSQKSPLESASAGLSKSEVESHEIPVSVPEPAISLPAMMELRAIQPVSMTIAIDGRPVQAYTLTINSLLRWRIRSSVDLQVASAAAVQVSLGGVAMNPGVESGQLVFPSVEN